MEVRANPRPEGNRKWSERFYEWLDRRTGLRGLLHEVLDEPIPGGASWAYVFGSGLLFLFISQVITGAFLALNYAPTADYAHVTLEYIVKQVNAGSFLRSVHAYGASAVIIVMMLHMIQTYTFGAYKGTRELLWIFGCLLFLLMLAMGFTGYLLPWDQRAYFATAVGTNIISELPVIGPGLRTLLRGGPDMGTLTVSRFFAIHVFFLPALIFAFVAIHVYLFRKAGPAGPPRADPFVPNLPTERFYPRQVFMDLVFTFVIVVVLGLLSVYRPHDLGPVANPAETTYLPRPDWYYRPIFQELKYFPGTKEPIGILIIPGVLMVLFFAVPWLDRSRERQPSKRPVAIGALFAVLAGCIALGAKSYWEDSHDPGVAEQLRKQQQAVRQYMRAPFKPALVGTAPQQGAAEPLVNKGRSIYEAKGCGSCHGDNGAGTPIAPALVGIGSKYSPEKLAELLRNPSPQMSTAGMLGFDLTNSDMNALIAYLNSLR